MHHVEQRFFKDTYFNQKDEDKEVWYVTPYMAQDVDRKQHIILREKKRQPFPPVREASRE